MYNNSIKGSKEANVPLGMIKDYPNVMDIMFQ